MRNGVRTFVLIAVVLDLPLLGRLARGLTREAHVEQKTIAGVPVEVVRPGGRGPWPTWLFVNGAHPERRREPIVMRLSRGLARAGFLVFVPDIPGLGEGAIGDGTLAATVGVTEAAAGHPDVRDGRVALIGASTGAGLAVLAAGHERLADRVSVVAAVAPFANLERMICLATTSAYGETGAFSRHEVTVLHRRVVARSLASTVTEEDDRVRLLAALDRAERADEDPIAALPRDVESDAARAVVALLTNEDPERFSELYAALPEPVLGLLARLSPVSGSGSVRAPVEIVVPPSDEYFPLGEAEALAELLPSVRLTVTATLDHTRPRLALSHLRSALRFGRFVSRGLSASA